MGGFGLARHNGIKILSLAVSQVGPEGPYLYPGYQALQAGTMGGNPIEASKRRHLVLLGTCLRHG
eukprot:11239814-Heterocapsa_arctica.AAC.1